MGLIKWIKDKFRKKTDKPIRHTFDDDDRARSLEIRAAQHQLKLMELQIRQRELEDELSQFQDDEEDSGLGELKQYLPLLMLINPGIAEKLSILTGSPGSVISKVPLAASEPSLPSDSGKVDQLINQIPDGARDKLRAYKPFVENLTPEELADLVRKI